MTYPEPKYFGSGEVTGATTDGRFGLYRWDTGPEPAGANAHFHRTFSESFFVLSGTAKLFDGRDWIDAHPGDFDHVPEGGLHGSRNESGEPASLLILFAPGAAREAYFEGLVELAEGRWKPSHEELRAFFEEHDNIYV